jgi:hypothetical protein
MYPDNDVRAKLSTEKRVRTAPARPADFVHFDDAGAVEFSAHGSRTWSARTEHLVMLWTVAVEGDCFGCDYIDELVVLTVDGGAALQVESGSQSLVTDEEAFVTVPPGLSTITARTAGPFVRLITTSNAAAARLAANARTFDKPDPNVAPRQVSLRTTGPDILRAYRVADRPLSSERFGRIYQSTHIMVNFLPTGERPRPLTHLSPHHHDDFEQMSLAVAGEFIHHIRYPWGPDATTWREDEHRLVDSPSVVVIPPPAVHTSQGVTDGHKLIDIFSPPRQDFISAGWTLNHDDYSGA